MKISYHLFLTIEIVMILFIYDKTLDGLLTALFDAYNRKTFPDVLLSKGDTLPLFYDDIFTVITDEETNFQFQISFAWEELQLTENELIAMAESVQMQES